MSAINVRIPWRTWQPQLFREVATYDSPALIADVIAGLTRMKLFVESINTFHPVALALGVGFRYPTTAWLHVGKCPTGQKPA